MMESSSLGAVKHPFQPSVSQRQGPAAAAEKTPEEPRSTRPESMTADQAASLQKLKQRDREVKAHELAHKSVAGLYARGAARFTYERGPDGQRYAVGGEVSIDISREADPRQTLQKALIVKQAALAPADPSAQDRQIAMQATQMAAEAQHEIAQLRAEARTGDASTDSGQTPRPRENDAVQGQTGGSVTNLRTERAIKAFIATSGLDLTPGAHPVDAFI